VRRRRRRRRRRKKKEKKAKKPASESDSDGEEASASKEKQKVDEDVSLSVYMAQGIGELLHGQDEKAENDDEENFLEQGMNLVVGLVDDIKSLPDKIMGEPERPDKTKVVRIVGRLDEDGLGFLSPVVLVDLVAAILEKPVKLISTAHEMVVSLSKMSVPVLIEELWRTVKKGIIEAYFRFLGLEDEDVDVRVMADIMKNYPNSNDIETELNDLGYGREGKVKAIEAKLSKKWMCERVAAALDPERTGSIDSAAGKAMVAKVTGQSESAVEDHADLKLLQGSTSKASSNLFKHTDRDMIEKYYEALDCGNPEPPAEILGKFAAIVKKWSRSFLMKVKLQELGWKKMGAQVSWCYCAVQ